MRLLNFSFIVLLPLIPAWCLWHYFGSLNDAHFVDIDKRIRAVGPIAGYLAILVTSFAFFKGSHSDSTQRVIEADRRQKRVVKQLAGKWIYNDTYHSVKPDGNVEEVTTTGHAEVGMLPEGHLTISGSWRNENDVVQRHWRSDDVVIRTRHMRVIYEVPAMHGRAPHSGVMTLQFLTDDEEKIVAMEGDYAVLGLQAYGTIKFKINNV